MSSYVDANADGVILFIDSISSSDRDYAIREVGSNFNTTNRELEEYGNTMYLVGIDSLDRFEARIQSTTVRIYLVTQTKGSVVYQTNDIEVADPSIDSWQELGADTYASFRGQRLNIPRRTTGGQDVKIGFRHADSVDDWNNDIGGGTHFQTTVGLRGDNTWAQYMDDDKVDVSIAAYTKGPAAVATPAPTPPPAWVTLAGTLSDVKEGGAIATDGTDLYALRGDDQQDFWRFDVSAGYLEFTC